MNDDAKQQTAWIELVDSMRAEVAKFVPLISAMRVEEVQQLVDLTNNLLWLDQRARTFEKDVDLKQARVVYGDGD